MRYFTPQNLLIAGLVYWFVFRKKNDSEVLISGGIPIKGEGYP